MTTGRFCAQCGKDAAGAAFCPYCGAAQAVAAPVAAQTPSPVPDAPIAPAAPLNAFCPNCGTKSEPGLTFCTNCGANLSTGVPLSPNQYAQPVERPSQTPIYVGVGAVVVALIIAVVVLSGGGGDSGTSSSSGTSGGGSASSQPTSQPATTARSGGGNTAPALPTLTPAPRIPAVDAPGGSIGPSDGRATDAVVTSMRQAGFNMTGVGVQVLSVRGTPDQMLVLSIDAKKATALNGSATNQTDQKKMLTAITAPPILKERRVTRLTIYINDTDPQQGAYTVVMTMPFTTVEGIAKGTITDAQAQQQIEIRTRKG